MNDDGYQGDSGALPLRGRSGALRAEPQASRAKPAAANADIPAISLWQPFASLIFEWDRERGSLAKCHETRGFKLPARLIGQWVAIHATAKFPADKFISEALNDLCYQLWGCGYNYSLPFGAVIGKVRFGASIPTGEEAPFQPEGEIAAGDWTPGRWAWPILEVKPWDPTPVKGKQGWWRFPAQVGGHRMAETALAGSGRSLTDAVGEADAPNLQDPHPTNPRDAQ